jgi:hypothetical protein
VPKYLRTTLYPELEFTFAGGARPASIGKPTPQWFAELHLLTARSIGCDVTLLECYRPAGNQAKAGP